MHQHLPALLLASDLQNSVLSACRQQQGDTACYTAYGHASRVASALSLLGFNGHFPDPATTCYVLGNGYRAYQPGLMRFLSPDNLSPFGTGGINSYAYCAGDPVNFKDNSGHTKSLIARFGRLPRFEIEIDHSPQQVASQEQRWQLPGNTRNFALAPKTRTTTFHREPFYSVPIGEQQYPIAGHHFQEFIGNGVEMKQLATSLQKHAHDPSPSSRWVNDLKVEINERSKRNQAIVKFGQKLDAQARSPEVQSVHIRGDYRTTSADQR